MINWMVMYQLIDGEYVEKYAGSNIVPTENIDKVIQVPEEIAKQSHKFYFDGNKLIRKENQYIMTLEQLKEFDAQSEIELWGGVPPHFQGESKTEEIEIVL